jgi:hypothetical protein
MFLENFLYLIFRQCSVGASVSQAKQRWQELSTGTAQCLQLSWYTSALSSYNQYLQPAAHLRYSMYSMQCKIQSMLVL